MKNAQKAKKHLKRLREIIAESPSGIFKMDRDAVIKTLRKTREAVWEEKLALRH